MKKISAQDTVFTCAEIFSSSFTPNVLAAELRAEGPSAPQSREFVIQGLCGLPRTKVACFRKWKTSER
jgi:hypothetical protein